MKTKLVITVLISFIVTQISFSQSLLIKGFFKNSDNESIQVDYLLVSNNQIVSSGTDKKVKVELKLNNDYTLIVSKKGFITKTVSFSTYTNDKNKYSFLFDMYLKENDEQMSNLTSTSTKVFYDTKLRAFNYVINKKQYSQH